MLVSVIYAFWKSIFPEQSGDNTIGKASHDLNIKTPGDHISLYLQVQHHHFHSGDSLGYIRDYLFDGINY